MGGVDGSGFSAISAELGVVRLRFGGWGLTLVDVGAEDVGKLTVFHGHGRRHHDFGFPSVGVQLRGVRQRLREGFGFVGCRRGRGFVLGGSSGL